MAINYKTECVRKTGRIILVKRKLWFGMIPWTCSMIRKLVVMDEARRSPPFSILQTMLESISQQTHVDLSHDGVRTWQWFLHYWTVTGGFPSQRPVLRTSAYIAVVRLSKTLNKQSNWFDMFWHSYDIIVICLATIAMTMPSISRKICAQCRFGV